MRLFKRIKDFARTTFKRGPARGDEVVRTVIAGSGPSTTGTAAATTPRSLAPLPAEERPFQLDLSTLNADQLDLTPGKDLDVLMRGFSVPQETLGKWISSGFLYPEEVRVAEKLIRLMRSPSRLPVGLADKPH